MNYVDSKFPSVTKSSIDNLLSKMVNFMNYVDSKFSSVTKSSIDKLLNKLVKKCFGTDF
jgi:hypothetical protein